MSTEESVAARAMLDDFGNWLHEHIKKSAYFKWQKAGCPQNKDIYFWKEAEKEFFPLPQAIAEVMGNGYCANDLLNVIGHAVKSMARILL